MKKKRLRRIWQHTRESDTKTRYNQQTKLVRESLQTFYNNEWFHILKNLKPNDPKIFRINISLIHKKPVNHPLQGQNGLIYEIYDSKEKAEIFAESLEN